MPKESIVIQIKPAVIQWLRASSGLTASDISRRSGIQQETYSKIENGEKNPTYKQVKLLAKAFHRPVTAFMLPSPPQEPLLPTDFRLLSDKKNEYSAKLRLVFRRARVMQESAKELMNNLGIDIAPKIHNVELSDSPENIASRDRILSQITITEQTKWKSPRHAFNAWREFIENKNIRVFLMTMPIEQARGFSLTNSYTYAIVVNTSDDVPARIFTLFHEYAHLLLSETGVCIPNSIVFSASDSLSRVERWCDRFAAEFLLPPESKWLLTEDNLVRDPLGRKIAIATLKRYASKFKVSNYALLIRMKEFRMISNDELTTIINEMKNTPRKKGKGGGGMTQLERCSQEKGQNYIAYVMENLDRGLINTKDALDHLSIKMKYLDELRGTKVNTGYG